MLDANEFSRLEISTATIVIGVLFLVEGIFMFIVIKGDRTMNQPSSRLLIHHSVLLMLLSLAMLKGGVFYFARSKSEGNCLWNSVTRDLLEYALEWNVVVLAFCAMTLEDSRKGMNKAILNSTSGQVTLIMTVWTLSVACTAGIYANPSAFINSKCGNFSYSSLAVSVGTVCTTYLLLVVLVLVALVRSKRCSRLVNNEITRTDSRTSAQGRVKVKGTLNFFCRLGCGLMLPYVVGRLYFISQWNPSKEDNHWLFFVASLLGFLWHISIFPLLLYRHSTLRQQMKHIILAKCFVYKHDSFMKSMDFQHQMRQSCRHMMQDPNVRMSIKKKRESLKSLQGPDPNELLTQQPT